MHACICIRVTVYMRVCVWGGGGSPLAPRDLPTDWLTDWLRTVRPSARPSVRFSSGRSLSRLSPVTGDGLEYDGDDGVRLFSRWRCRSALPSPRPFIPSPRQPPSLSRSQGLSSSLTAGSTSQQHPRHPTIAASPIRRIQRMALLPPPLPPMLLLLLLLLLLLVSYEGLHSYPSRVLMSVLDSCRSLFVVVRIWYERVVQEWVCVTVINGVGHEFFAQYRSC